MRDPMNDVMMNLMTGRGERIIQYLNIIRIVEAEYQYSYSYSGVFFKPNNICIRIWSIFSNRIIFVFVSGHFWKVEKHTFMKNVHLSKCISYSSGIKIFLRGNGMGDNKRTKYPFWVNQSDWCWSDIVKSATLGRLITMANT